MGVVEQKLKIFHSFDRGEICEIVKNSLCDSCILQRILKPSSCRNKGALEEDVGFEPTLARARPAFKAGAFDHSANLPA